MGSNSLKRWPQWLWCTDIWCIQIHCTILSVHMYTISAFWGGFYVFLFYGPPCHIILLISSHPVVRINYFSAVSSFTTHILLNCLSIHFLSFNSIQKFIRNISYLHCCLTTEKILNVVFALSIIKYLFNFPIPPSSIFINICPSSSFYLILNW